MTITIQQLGRHTALMEKTGVTITEHPELGGWSSTYNFDNDEVHWGTKGKRDKAILAHELGHSKNPRFSRISEDARVFAPLLSLLGTGVAIGASRNNPRVARLAAILGGGGALALSLPSLIAEGMASYKGVNILRQLEERKRQRDSLRYKLRPWQGYPTYLGSAAVLGGLPFLAHYLSKRRK